MEKHLEFLENMVQCFGVQMRTFAEPLADLTGFDGGLRSRLFKNHDTGYLTEFMCAMDCAVLYMAEDSYGCHYCFLKYNGGGGGVMNTLITVLLAHGLKVYPPPMM
jgi:hypothetical protein